MTVLYWLFGVIAYLVVGEAITAFTVFLVPKSVLNKKGQFAWYWVSARVVLWWVVLLFAFFYLLSLPVRAVYERIHLQGTKPKLTKPGLQNIA